MPSRSISQDEGDPSAAPPTISLAAAQLLSLSETYLRAIWAWLAGTEQDAGVQVPSRSGKRREVMHIPLPALGKGEQEGGEVHCLLLVITMRTFTQHSLTVQGTVEGNLPGLLTQVILTTAL